MNSQAESLSFAVRNGFRLKILILEGAGIEMADTRNALLDSAERRIRRYGFDAVSYADVAKDVGIRKPSIHYHFATKGDLSIALVERYHARFLEKLDDMMAQDTCASAKLLVFLDLYRDALEGGRSLCLCVALSVTQQALPMVTKAALARYQTDVISRLEAVFQLAQADTSIDRVTDPYAEACATLAQVEGAQIMARSAGDPTRFEAATDVLRRRALI